MDMVQALFLESEPFRWLVRCTLVLVAKVLLSNVYVGITKLRHQVYTSPEDRRLFTGTASAADSRFSPVPHPAVERAYAVLRNDQENIYPFFIVALLYVLCGGGTWYCKVYMVTFTVSRCLHTLAYMAGVQPWRGIFFFGGLIVTLIMMAEIASKMVWFAF
mmetsp:Transcript_40852/g.102853  ORF Transcript_40852/g.102853 Transcript_40852/m.102853 type:complete len:161 (+) Transcript_40852:922-1404(+)